MKLEVTGKQLDTGEALREHIAEKMQSVVDKYFERNVRAGPGSFVIIANDYDAYEEAILRKLLREIMGPATS